MGSSHDCTGAELQVSEVGQNLRDSEVLFEFRPLTSAPGRIRTCAHGSGGGRSPTTLPALTAKRQGAWSASGPQVSYLAKARHSSWWPRPHRPPHFPLMTKRIEDPAPPRTVLIGHFGCRCGTGPYRLGKHRVGIIDHQQSPARRAADRLRAEPRSIRSAR